jgi:hypothetical protein
MTVHCDRCGAPLAAGSHVACSRARALEPPRYCGQCGRRLKVQVLPSGFHATCAEHGPIPAFS